MIELGPVNGHEVVNQLANNSTFHALTSSIKGKEDQEASNFYFNIEPYSSCYNDPKAEAFWAEFAREGAT
jgi:hypothetical protein